MANKQKPKDGMGFIYTLSHPDSPEKIRYIGQTERSLYKRLLNHKNSAKNDNRLRTPIQDWIFKLLSEGLLPIINLLAEVPLSELNETEIRLISLGRVKYNLLNLSNGGKIEGRKIGSKASDETKAKLKKSARRGWDNNKFLDRTGMRYGKLTVIKYIGSKNGASNWDCICDCGKFKQVDTYQFRRITSCGCARKTRWDEKAKADWKEKLNNKVQRSKINGRYEAIRII